MAAATATPASSLSSVRLTDNNAGKICCTKLFTENSLRINSIDYSADGEHMITSSDDDSISLYNINDGVRTRTVNSKKYGVDLIRFSHQIHSAVHCSTKVDDTIRFLSLHDNKYIRYFSGHTKKVICLCMSPLDDMFLSGSLDKSIRLWDIRSNNCQGLMQVSGKAIAAFDPEGLIFAAGINNEQIKLYDLRSFDKGPFTTFKMDTERSCEWTSMSFSPDGKTVMICTSGNVVRLVDAFTGTLRQTLMGHRNQHEQALHASFTPCSGYVFCPSSDKTIYGYSCDKGEIVARIPTDHDSHMSMVAFNPKFYMLSAACTKLGLYTASDEFP